MDINSELTRRLDEVKVYLDSIDTICQPSVDFRYSSINKDTTQIEEKIFSPDPIFQQTLIAGTWVMMYNVVESTVRNALLHIIDNIHREGLDFINLTKNYQIELARKELKDIIKTNDYYNRIVGFVDTALLSMLSDPEVVISEIGFGGNIDARKLSEIYERFSITKADDWQYSHREKLRTIKGFRNDLAHGVITYRDCGKQFTVADLRVAFEAVSAILNSFVEDVNKVILDKPYRRVGVARSIKHIPV